VNEEIGYPVAFLMFFMTAAPVSAAWWDNFNFGSLMNFFKSQVNQNASGSGRYTPDSRRGQNPIQIRGQDQRGGNQ